MNLIALSDDACRDRRVVGTKSANLALLFNAFSGSIPCGWVLPANETAPFLAESPDWAFERATHALRLLLDETGLSNPEQCYAVRSSALGEDLPDRSYAGQYESILAVRTIKALVDAVVQCVRSGKAPRVQAYQQSSSHDPTPVAVLIQSMIAAERSGVAFTLNPVSGATEYVINATYGLGDLLVGGEITPDEIIIGHDGTLLRHSIGTKRYMRLLTGAGLIKVEVPASLQTAPCLSQEQVQLIVDVARRCEVALDYPTDLEWAISYEQLFILQARPITGLPRIRSTR